MLYFISLFCVLTKWCNNYISIQYYKQMHTCTLHFKHHVNWWVIWLVMILMHCLKFYVFVFANSQIIYKVLMSTMIALYFWITLHYLVCVYSSKQMSFRIYLCFVSNSLFNFNTCTIFAFTLKFCVLKKWFDLKNR